MRKLAHLCVVFLLVLSLAAGCASQTTRSYKTTAHYPAESAEGQTEASQHPQEQGAIETHTEETTTETKGESFGLLSGTVHVVGQALALPFRLVGGLIGLAF